MIKLRVFTHEKNLLLYPSFKTTKMKWMKAKKNVELIETLFHLEVVYLSVSALLVLCISWFAQRGLNLWCLLDIFHDIVVVSCCMYLDHVILTGRRMYNWNLIVYLPFFEVVYLRVSALLVLCISWFPQRGIKLWCLLLHKIFKHIFYL